MIFPFEFSFSKTFGDIFPGILKAARIDLLFRSLKDFLDPVDKCTDWAVIIEYLHPPVSSAKRPEQIFDCLPHLGCNRFDYYSARLCDLGRSGDQGVAQDLDQADQGIGQRFRTTR